MPPTSAADPGDQSWTSSGALTRARLSRRAALGAVAAVVGGAVAGCTPERQTRQAPRPRPTEPEMDPDVGVAAEALADQQEMIELVTATQKRHSRLAEVLAPVLATHEAHAAMLVKAVPDKVRKRPSPSPSPSGSAVRRTPVPRDDAHALEQVVTREQELRTSTKQHAFKAESGAFARVLASMAAAAEQQAVLLHASAAARRSSS